MLAEVILLMVTSGNMQIKLDTIQLGDCLEIMPSIPDKSIDAIICDPPYNVLSKTNASAKWDSIIPFEPMWAQLERIIKDNGAIVLFGQGMFTARLMMSNPKLWRYNIIWKKGNRTSGFLNANRMPLRNHEDICVFYKKLPTYNPQMEWGEKSHPRGGDNHKHTQRCYGGFKDLPLTEPTNWKYPKSVIDFERDYDKILHPTQKPINLMSWLIRTYTNAGGNSRLLRWLWLDTGGRSEGKPTLHRDRERKGILRHRLQASKRRNQ